ncbi:TetR/AcrR family transcriptional regulator [Actinoplanes derwentensis]|uniref:Tetracyclin repressor, C-terminal all-alpha domain n=1 Tax=Actinoplanes derwentensis TaxID=113562 RepID=A0A1H1U0Q2_9ACTN|nr:TetR family transcriptional regulator [Actinoplanes derwentensis]GID85163.1 TetR family transcriptional regulator [Actinoplanes derwentensis]SDS66090.1 Tetracyclin repressor, C-terminal all-alpha domain [Actinoplanes derwentensis]
MRKPLTRQRVLTAAVAIADAEGIGALTMRRLGAELGVEAMSLYHHLHGKDALLDGVVESLIEEILEAADGVAERDWRRRLRGQFLAAREVVRRHPWGPGLLAARKTVPFGVFQYYDGIIATLLGAGFDYRIAHRALHAFGTLPLGVVPEIFQGGDPGPRATELPHLMAMVASESHEAEIGWCDSRVEFEFTVDLLLDGLHRTYLKQS